MDDRTLEEMEEQFDPTDGLVAVIDTAVDLITETARAEVIGADDEADDAEDRLIAILPEDPDDVAEMLQVTLELLAIERAESDDLRGVLRNMPTVTRTRKWRLLMAGAAAGLIVPYLVLASWP